MPVLILDTSFTCALIHAYLICNFGTSFRRVYSMRPPRVVGISRGMFFICFTSLFWQRSGTPVGIDHLVVYGLRQPQVCQPRQAKQYQNNWRDFMSITWSHQQQKYPLGIQSCFFLLSVAAAMGRTVGQSNQKCKDMKCVISKAWLKIYVKQNRNIFGFSHTFDSEVPNVQNKFQQTNKKK